MIRRRYGNPSQRDRQELNISEGRVTQLTHNALAKLGKAYLTILDTKRGNPYRQIES